MHHIPVFTDEIRFHLRGTFVSDRTTSHSPVYLHVPPLSPEWINSMPCLRCPSISTLFYWSSDPLGLIKIPETDWEAYGIPNLRVDTYLACSWLSSSYFAVWDYLRLKNYDLDGEQFATQHGYSHLIKGDPHVQFETYPSPGPDNFLTLIEWVKTPDMRRAVSGPLHRMSYG
ncbi:hypothetical protein L218DRAFT_964534 [Marasmius fiardii PR-910]|nr:hypothetical protein L218DRAFT_964534 [Marasmius fiardii PR-910]